MLYTALTLAITAFSLVFCQDLCVKNTPYATSSEWWDGKYNKTGTYYLKTTPGSFLFIYKVDESCPYDLQTCWCFSTSSPGTETKTCYIVGNGTSTPDEVTEWYTYYPQYYQNGTIYARNFTVDALVSDETCVTPKTLSTCYRATASDSTYHGKYNIQNNKIWWDQYQYKYSHTENFISYKYFLFLSTRYDSCGATLLDTLDVDYCWCLSSYQADDFDGSCTYTAPVADTETPPTEATWYTSSGQISTKMGFNDCSNSSSNHKDSSTGTTVAIVIVCIVIVCGVVCLYALKKKRKSERDVSNLAENMITFDKYDHVLMVTETKDLRFVKRTLNRTPNLYYQDVFIWDTKVFVIFYTSYFAQNQLKPRWNENFKNKKKYNPFNLVTVPQEIKDDPTFQSHVMPPKRLPRELAKNIQMSKRNREDRENRNNNPGPNENQEIAQSNGLCC